MPAAPRMRQLALAQSPARGDHLLQVAGTSRRADAKQNDAHLYFRKKNDAPPRKKNGDERQLVVGSFSLC
jgi:hypothetical protein